MLKRLSICACAAAAVLAASAEQSPPDRASQPEPPAPAVQPAMPPAMFQPVAIDPELVRQSMQARAELDRLNRAINARRNALFEGNDELKALQAEMRGLQEQIDGILKNDATLQELQAKQREIAPELPAGARAFPMAPKPPAAVTAPDNE